MRGFSKETLRHKPNEAEYPPAVDAVSKVLDGIGDILPRVF
ncbi:hypothetical protein GGD63_005850 [Bradyrhizobium sp. cir1]|nr:hypothetical protein [Bradyrhizobium sp. cir1]MBB4373035.1 hypothetical protein [Bradyrhizobium sp. cir1]